MFTISIKGLWAHKRRLLGTFLAVLLGVSFLSGTLVLSDTLRSNFDDLFAAANAGTDAVVRSTARITGEAGGGPDTREVGQLPATLVDRLRTVDGVAAAQPTVQGYGQLLSVDGKPVGGNGPPRLAGNWITDPQLTPYRLAEGRAPRADDEVVINRAAATAGKLHVGDTTTVQMPEPIRVRIVGIARWGSSGGFGKATYTAFTLPAAQRYVIKRPGQVSTVALRATPGVSQDELVRRLRAVLPAGSEALTGAELTRETTRDLTGQFVNLVEAFLVVFAGIALLVATFSINNAFSIIVAQRNREAALLRAIGASRRQVLAAVVTETLIVGVIASVAGLFGGLGIAGLLKGMFDSFGFALPDRGLVFTARTVLVALTVGVGATLLAGLMPAVRASRVAPLAALRGAESGRTGPPARRTALGLTCLAAGVTVVLTAVTGDGGLAWAATGALVTFVGVLVLGPVAARTATRVIGGPLPRLRGVTGALARQNAMRNPRRTAGSASALMIGVGVVTLFTVFAASVQASAQQSVSRSFGGDLAVTTPGFGGGGFSPRLSGDLTALPEVGTAVGIGNGAVLLDGSATRVTVTDPAALDRLLDLDVTSGTLAGVGTSGLAVAKKAADERGWRVGTPVRVGFADRQSVRLRVAAIYRTTDVAGSYVLPRAVWAPHATQQVDSLVLVKLVPGVSVDAGKRAVEKATAGYGSPTVQDRKEYAATAAAGINLLLGIVYVLLALAIVIALMGIANTLSLSVHERTRELGLLRAVGQTRAQTRSMVRWESTIVAAFGTVGGLGLGLFLGWALVRAVSSDDTAAFSAPLGRLALVLVAGAVAGVAAGLRPARRAARLGVLTAVAAE